ncbi:MAG: DUF350 domain-containing protein [Cyclobacteriaceae bacterium]
MNYRIALLGLLEIVSALSIGVVILAITYMIVKRVGRKYYDIEHGNTAYSIFTASIMFSVGYMVSSVIQPLISSYRLMSTSNENLTLAWKYISQGFIYIGIAYISSLLIGLISTALYARITPIDEFEEIKNNNVGVAIVVSSIIITLTLMSKSGVTLLIESIIPYPELGPR